MRISDWSSDVCSSDLFIEQRIEVRVVDRIADNEAGVDRQHAVRRLHLDGVGVAADACVLLEDRDVVTASEQIGGRQTGDAGADDGNFHGDEWRDAECLPYGPRR